MEGLNFIRKYSILSRWLLSYFVLLLTTLVICLFAYGNAIGLVRTETMRVITASTEQVSSNMDLIIRNIGEVARQLSKDEYLYSFLYHNGTDHAEDAYQTYKLVNELDTYVKIYDDIEDILVYRYDDDVVVNRTSRYSSERYFAFYGYRYFGDYQQWIDQMKAYHYLDSFPNQIGDTTRFSLLHSVFRVAREESRGLLIVVPDYGKISTMLQDIQLSDKSHLLFFDEQGTLVFGSGFFEQDAMSVIKQASPSDAVQYIRLDGEEYAVNAVVSGKTGWKCVTVLPGNTFSQPMLSARNWVVFSLLLALVVGLIFSFIASKINYAPVRSLLGLLNRNEARNEYQHIEQGIYDILRERNALDHSIDLQRKALRENLLERIIVGHVDSTERVSSLSASYGLSIPHNRFRIILFAISNFEQAAYDGKATARRTPQEDETLMDIIRFAIKNIGEELLSEVSLSYMVDIPGFVACLLNYPDEREESIEADIFSRLTKEQALLVKHFQADITAAVSGSEALEKVNGLYAQAIEAIEYAEETNDSIIFYSLVPKRVIYGSSLVNAEYQVLNCIVTFDYKNAIPAIEALFEACRATVEENKPEKGRMIGLCNLFSGIADTLVQRYDLDEHSAHDFKTALPLAKSLDRMERMCVQLFEHVAIHSRQRKEDLQEEIIQQVQQYIQAHYCEPDLSVTSIADQFEIAMPRLSRQFKDFNGEGMLDYINRLRIEQAKKLINEKGTAVKDVGELVGFTNTQTFIRVFKKYEGTTPGRLKRSETRAGKQE